MLSQVVSAIIVIIDVTASGSGSVTVLTWQVLIQVPEAEKNQGHEPSVCAYVCMGTRNGNIIRQR